MKVSEIIKAGAFLFSLGLIGDQTTHGQNSDLARSGIVGEWRIVQGNGHSNVWKFNSDFTYNYGRNTGTFQIRGGKFFLKHTWDWELELVNRDRFVGVCTRGGKGVTVKGTRIRDGVPTPLITPIQNEIKGRWNLERSDGYNAIISIRDDGIHYNGAIREPIAIADKLLKISGNNRRITLTFSDDKNTGAYKDTAGLSGTLKRIEAGTELSIPEMELHEPGLRGILVAEGDAGKGTGFFVAKDGRTYLYSNAHVFSGNNSMAFKLVSGEEVEWKDFQVSTTEDIARAPVSKDYPAYEMLDSIESSVSLGDKVYVLGNSHGEGTIRNVVGKITGIGPEKIEVDAPFVSGNSGSPVIHSNTGKVIGVATYAVKRKADWVTEGTPFSSVRRFAVRIDTAKDWESPSWERFVKESKALRSFESTNLLLVCFLAYYEGHVEQPLDLYDELIANYGLLESKWVPEVREGIKNIFAADISGLRATIKASEYDRDRNYRSAIKLVRKVSADMDRFKKEHFCTWHQKEFLEHLAWREEIRRHLHP